MQYYTMFIVLAVLDYVYFKLKYVRRKGPPVFNGLPFIGILPILILPKRFYLPIFEWYLKNGPPVAITRHIYPLVLVKGSYVNEVQKNGDCYHRTTYPPFKTVGELAHGKEEWCLFDGDNCRADWKPSRKINVMALHVLPKKQKFEKISEVAGMFLERIERQQGKLWDYEDDLTFAKLQESSNLNLGATFDDDSILEFMRIMKAFLRVGIGFCLFSLIVPLKFLLKLEKWLPYSKRPSVFSRVYKESLWRLQKKKMESPTDEAHDYIEGLLRVQSPEVTHQHMLEHAIFLLVASTITTLHSTISMLSYIAKFPQYQRKIFEEFQRVVGAEKLNADHLDKMHFLRAVINETLRMSAPATFFERYTRVPTKLGDVAIPGNITLVLLIESELKDEKTYPEPKKFNPYRFLSESSQVESLNAPFSRGKRKCPGQDIALMTTALYAAKIVQHFELEPEHPDVKIPEYDGGVFPNPPLIPLRFIRRPNAPPIEHVELRTGLTDILQEVIRDDLKNETEKRKIALAKNKW